MMRFNRAVNDFCTNLTGSPYWDEEVLGASLGAGPEGARRRAGVLAVRHHRRARLLHSPRLRQDFRRFGRAHFAALLRSLRQLRAGFIDRCGASHGERHQPQFSGPLWTGSSLAGQPAHSDGQCAGGGVDLV